MASYMNGEQTKISIVESGKELFYLNGYDSTRCQDIAKKAGIKPGLIHYHFKSKGSIALEIYSHLLESLVITTLKLYPGASTVLLTAIQTRIYWSLIESSENFRRFVYQISLDRVIYDISVGAGVHYYQEIDDEVHTGFNTDKLLMLAYCYMGAQTEMIIKYIEGRFDLSIDELVDMDIKIQFQMLDIDDAHTAEIIRQSKEEFDKLRLKMGANFVPKISMRI